MRALPQRTRHDIAYLKHRENISRLVGNDNPGGHVLSPADYPLGEHFPRGKDRFPVCGLQIGKLTAFRVGVEFIDMEEISRHQASGKPSLINIILCNRFQVVSAFVDSGSLSAPNSAGKQGAADAKLLPCSA